MDIMDVHGSQTSAVDRLASKILLVLVFLLPFFIIPTPLIGLVFGKSALLLTGVMLALIAWSVTVLRESSFKTPSWLVALALVLVPLVYFVSSLVGPATRVSLIGHNLSPDSTIMVAVMALFAFLVVVTTKTSKQFLHYYGAFVLSLLLVALVHALRLVVGPDLLSFGVLPLSVSSVLGKWNDMAVFFGAGLVLSLVTLLEMSTKKHQKSVIYVVVAVSLVFLAIVNFTPVWYVVGSIAFLLLIYKLSSRGRKKDNADVVHRDSGSILSIVVVLVVSLLFIVAGSTLGPNISNTLDVSQAEIRPSWSSTFAVTDAVLQESSVFGIGPNRFGVAWLAHKPLGVNETLFWDVEFNSSIGVLPSAFVTSGIVGAASWLLLLCVFLYYGVRSFFSNSHETKESFLVVSSFITALYLWVFMMIYTPSVVVRALTFLFTGLFFAGVFLSGRDRLLNAKFSKRAAPNFVLTLVFILVIVVGVLGVYTAGKRLAGGTFFQRGLAAEARGDTELSERELLRATRLYPSDFYHRTLSGTYLAGLNDVLVDRETSQEVLLSSFQTELGNAIASARRAVEIDETNYANWFALGTVYASVAPLGIEGAYENAVDAFEEAAKRNPGPDIFLARAQLEVNNGDTNKAREFIDRALSAKSNYIDAVFLLTQIQIGEGNIVEAIRSVEVATQISPDNPAVFFQLGLLHYSTENFTQAIRALEVAISLSPVYANAKYFLGLSYDRVGRRSDAIRELEGIQETNPDNREVAVIVANLRAGREPFSEAKPPFDESPENRDVLPLEEESLEAEI